MPFSNAVEAATCCDPCHFHCGLRGGTVYLNALIERRMTGPQAASGMTYTRIVLQRYGTSFVRFEERRQLLIAFRDTIDGGSAFHCCNHVESEAYVRTLEDVAEHDPTWRRQPP